MEEGAMKANFPQTHEGKCSSQFPSCPIHGRCLVGKRIGKFYFLYAFYLTCIKI